MPGDLLELVRKEPGQQYIDGLVDTGQIAGEVRPFCVIHGHVTLAVHLQRYAHLYPEAHGLDDFEAPGHGWCSACGLMCSGVAPGRETHRHSHAGAISRQHGNGRHPKLDPLQLDDLDRLLIQRDGAIERRQKRQLLVTLDILLFELLVEFVATDGEYGIPALGKRFGVRKLQQTIQGADLGQQQFPHHFRRTVQRQRQDHVPLVEEAPDSIFEPCEDHHERVQRIEVAFVDIPVEATGHAIRLPPLHVVE